MVTAPRVLTFDISMSRTGWSFMSPDEKRPVWGHHIIKGWKGNQEIEVERFEAAVNALFDRFNPTHVAYEGIFVDFNAFDFEGTEAQMALVTIIWLVARKRGVKVYKVLASDYRGEVTGSLGRDFKGKARHLRRAEHKKRAIKVCLDRGWLVTYDDEAEALCIGIYVLVQLDPLFASRQGPLFRRAQMHADREAMVR